MSVPANTPEESMGGGKGLKRRPMRKPSPRNYHNKLLRHFGGFFEGEVMPSTMPMQPAMTTAVSTGGKRVRVRRRSASPGRRLRRVGGEEMAGGKKKRPRRVRRVRRVGGEEEKEMEGGKKKRTRRSASPVRRRRVGGEEMEGGKKKRARRVRRVGGEEVVGGKKKRHRRSASPVRRRRVGGEVGGKKKRDRRRSASPVRRR